VLWRIGRGPVPAGDALIAGAAIAIPPAALSFVLNGGLTGVTAAARPATLLFLTGIICAMAFWLVALRPSRAGYG
jgi:hypothetical protein